ncbi:enoyl-CoA hydratase/isomerase family protein [Primorskyibacter flagellatus]|uniref:Enoyl-CoA hydratase/carnithine racemase n=1 Tax=Primorskyibacter flagellatus TaxID=1387277 RepID=A0A1W2DF13_9RHOB|nr:enoyl-CoA hydratase/isomerase family protein [Primorskyibacter flagellatus]SMC95844.1 Enoyl-CoA hydratase/carnithine racemase [Primorskyibacter flagellatus]
MSTVHLIQHGAIAELRLDNPAKMNAFTVQMLDQLAAHLEVIERDTTIAALILTAEGDRAFCTGADINGWGDLGSAEFARHWVRDGHRIFDRLARLSKPTVAAMQGHAFGGGLELAAACDIRVMAPKAALALPEAGVGIVPGWSGTQRLLRLLPEPMVKEMALFGNRIKADRALACGFVAAVDPDPRTVAETLLERAITLSPRAVEIAKSMIHAAQDEDRAAMVEALGSAAIAATEDRAEGVAAFRAKRKPDFSGR